jgi:hypothetical protein
MNDFNELLKSDYQDISDSANEMAIKYAVELVDVVVRNGDVAKVAKMFDKNMVDLFGIVSNLFSHKLTEQELPDAFIADMQCLVNAMNSYASASAICRTMIEIERHKQGKINDTNE